MWQFALRGPILRFAQYALLPVSIAIGAAGYYLEQTFARDKIIRDNKDLESAWERRNARQLKEMNETPASDSR